MPDSSQAFILSLAALCSLANSPYASLFTINYDRGDDVLSVLIVPILTEVVSQPLTMPCDIHSTPHPTTLILR